MKLGRVAGAARVILSDVGEFLAVMGDGDADPRDRVNEREYIRATLLKQFRARSKSNEAFHETR